MHKCFDNCPCGASRPEPASPEQTQVRRWSDHDAEEVAVTVAEFIVRLNIRATATPDVREAAAIERVVGVVFDLLEQRRAVAEGLREIKRVNTVDDPDRPAEITRALLSELGEDSS